MGDVVENPEMLVTRRSKRSTAGNRMEAALAEMALDDANKDLDDDNDFVNDKGMLDNGRLYSKYLTVQAHNPLDEEDIFGSDFESTDEEAEKQANEAGENEVINEERMVKKAARTRLEKITAAAHAKNKATFNPDIQLTTVSKPKLRVKLKQRVVVGAAIDAESGDVVAQSRKDDADGNKRTSQRKHTIQNTSATVTRLKQVQAKRAAQPKKAKVEYKTYTQGELIALALDTEEGNIVDHRDYLKNEAEKRKRARVVRTAVEGPLLRWISRKEEVKVEIPPPPVPIPAPPISAPAFTTHVFAPAAPTPAPAPGASTATPAQVASTTASAPGMVYAPSSTIYRSVYGPPGNLFTPTTYSYTAGMTVVSTNASTPQIQINSTPSTYSQTTTTTFSHYQPVPDPAVSAFPTWPPPTTAQPSPLSIVAPPTSTTAKPDTQPPLQALPTPNPVVEPVQPPPISNAEPPLLPPPPPPEPEYRLETVTKNYVVHELAQQKGTPKPTWAQSMQAMFGDHVKWDQLKVFVGKGRPLSRPRQLCPITGRQAHYLDPRSGVPYADAYSYKVLTGLLNHEFVWDTELACYLNRESPSSGDAGEGDQAVVAEGGDGMEVDETNLYMSSRLTSSPRTGKSHSHSAADQSRPWTGQSRPTTARPQTSASVRHDGSYVVAVLEGRGVSREVGIAALDKDTGKVMLVQIADCQTYVKSLHQMHVHNPCLVLIPDTFLSAADAALAPSGKRSASTSLLVEYIREEFPGIQIESVGRRYWNDAGGLEFVLQLCVEDDERAGTVLAVSNKYYALSAACALFKYAEGRLNTRFAAASLRIKYVPVEGTMMIDPDTARNLELVGNMTHKKSSHSLFGVLNYTYTPMASRLLRVNILSPITVQSSIDARLDVVDELINAEDRFSYTRDALKTLNKMDFDKLIVALASSEVRASTNAKPASQRISQILNLRNVVKNIPLLRKALEGCYSQLLRIVCDMLSDERIDKIDKLISLHLNEEGAPLKGGLAALNARKKMNSRMKDALDEALMLSDKIIQDLMAEIVADVGALYKASEAVALVDMLWSFAHASIMRNYVRPEFTGTLAIKSGRHPILETLQSAGTLVPNDVYCDNSSSFQIIQGPNMSGKSTYLRQVGMLTVMALCGCFVPAEYASFRIHDFLLSRLSNEDDLEKNLSTFASEMASSAMILGIELARLADLPSDVLAESKRVAEKLAALQTRNEESSESHKITIRRKALLRLRTQLTQAYEYSALPDQELLDYIGRFQADIAKAFLQS
ncbi:hypothetical protein CVT25_010677 [Psilocybe cyanescens]|uniref:DNA mismatch repair proteins mutS family domain-containing protein n=1 Tax=Psilocybe cyanescens TaxID=93625 RepID=A0A409WJV6_PSICY|nr:hypothetical protein CVT25_010677 [Psilocybe cyanescens]